MKKLLLFASIALTTSVATMAQERMTPELLWSLGQVSPISISPDGNNLWFQVKHVDINDERTSTSLKQVNLNTLEQQEIDFLGEKSFVAWTERGIYALKDGILYLSNNQGKKWSKITDGLYDVANVTISPDGNWIAYSKKVMIKPALAKDIYTFAEKSEAKIYTDLDYRHWDKWSDGTENHIFVKNLITGKTLDIMEGEPYTSPTKPFGGAGDFVFTPNSNQIVYVCKKKTGKEYALSTNTDLYVYDFGTGKTKNITEENLGYDVSPKFSPDGSKLAWLQMATDGYEADKNDLIIMDWETGYTRNMTGHWDATIDGNFQWSNDSERIYFNASHRGTVQAFNVSIPKNLMVRSLPPIIQISEGKFDITSIIGENKHSIIVTSTSHNYANEIFALPKREILKGNRVSNLRGISRVNDATYESLDLGHSELRMIKTRDGHEMGVWVIYPPNFDSSKKYPTLLYCQGGPQSGLTQFYSLRWNFQLMAANDYIIVAPNRRGMPGWGVKWNEIISGDWGGGPMNDYLDAIDALAKEPYVDNTRLGAVGASYGGYSVFMLAGIHNNRFKTFIAHNGLFDMRSWYGTTEELFFANWDIKGNYWKKPTPSAFTKYNPSNFVDRWNTPILIYQGEQDFRVPIGQGLQAFQAAQLKNIKSKLVFFPNENHWVLKPHNGLVWQKEFFSWLKETL